MPTGCSDVSESCVIASLRGAPGGTGKVHGRYREYTSMQNDMRDWYLIAFIALLSAAAIWLLVLFGR